MNEATIQIDPFHSNQARLLSNFYRGLLDLYPEAKLGEMSSEVEITLKVKVSLSPIHDILVYDYGQLKVINNGVDYSKNDLGNSVLDDSCSRDKMFENLLKVKDLL